MRDTQQCPCGDPLEAPAPRPRRFACPACGRLHSVAPASRAALQIAALHAQQRAQSRVATLSSPPRRSSVLWGYWPLLAAGCGCLAMMGWMLAKLG